MVFGSAITGAGVRDLLDTLATPAPRGRLGTASGEPAGTVFKVDRGEGGRIVLARVRSGSLRVRDRVVVGGRPAEKVTALRVFDRGRLVTVDEVPAGRIAAVTGWSSARIGDRFGATDGRVRRRPGSDRAVLPTDPGDRRRPGAAHRTSSRCMPPSPSSPTRTR